MEKRILEPIFHDVVYKESRREWMPLILKKAENIGVQLEKQETIWILKENTT
jgi:hypothetical protein